MGELTRRRSAHEVWISRGHLWAMGLGAVLLGVIGFAAGTLVGGGEVAHAAASVEPIPVGGVPDDSLVELLARVEATSDPTGGVGELTFPDTLAGEPALTVIPAPVEARPLVTSVAPGIDDLSPQVDARPVGTHTIDILRTPDLSRAHALRDQLTARDLPSWVGAEQREGERVYRVSVGGFGSEADASAALDEWRALSLPIIEHAVPAPL